MTYVRSRIRRPAVLGLGLALVAVSALAVAVTIRDTPDGPESSSVADGMTAEGLLGLSSALYHPVASLEELKSRSEIVVLARLADVREGLVQGDLPVRHVRLEFRSPDHPGPILIELARPQEVSLEHARAMFPVGRVRAVLYLRNNRAVLEQNDREHPTVRYSNLPPDPGTWWTPATPQGLILEVEGRLIVPGDTESFNPGTRLEQWLPPSGIKTL